MSLALILILVACCIVAAPFIAIAISGDEKAPTDEVER